ncbi:WD repeat-containing protein 34 isoform X1 [Fundulus heteroclitus]|uniref:WD repeat-containing protein 34 isoform X1 n=1 Tax=Fundulus heteroclitus TaxID=8078 RepID=UPI00165AF881|nr:WD repeat-containing protein 34 isoform X1 [Fundulus heteroclitus]
MREHFLLRTLKMFADEALDPVTVASVWRKAQQGAQHSRGCQTPAVLSDHAGVQTRFTASSSTQTEPQEQNLQEGGLGGPDPPGLVDFLKRVEDPVTKELEKNSRSHAFDGYQANWEEGSDHVSLLHSLQHPGAEESGLHVSAVSWSCTGSVIVCAYGRTDDGDWTHQKSCVCLWNLDRRRLRPKQADLVLEVPAAVTSVCCHPERPALIAGGLYNGEVVVWDTSRTQDPVLAQTGMSADSHREPVYQVVWVPLQKKGDFGVLSSSSGGEVLLWLVDPDQGRLVLNAAYAFVRQQLPHSSSLKSRGSSRVGVSALALSPWDADTFLVGSEGGLLLRCSFSCGPPAAVAPEGRSVAPRAPARFCFRPAGGPVHSLHCSPFHRYRLPPPQTAAVLTRYDPTRLRRNLFISAGTDGEVRLGSLLQADPLLAVRVSDSYVFQAQWSPSRPLVFAAATGQGEVQIFDLARKSLRPAATIRDGAADRTATCLAFNGADPRLLAAGRSDGTVGVWLLSSDLTEQRAEESLRLEQIANQVAE